MNLKHTHLTVILTFLLTLTAQAVITITINPDLADEHAFWLTVSGTGGTVTGAGDSEGRLTLDGNAFSGPGNITDTGLFYGDSPITTASTATADQFYFSVSGFLPADSAYSFTPGTAKGSTGPVTYSEVFTPGDYNIIYEYGWAGIFGDDATGTFTIAAPIPEPATYAALAGALFLDLALWKRRHS